MFLTDKTPKISNPRLNSQPRQIEPTQNPHATKFSSEVNAMNHHPLHLSAVKLAKDYLIKETELISLIQEIDKAKVYELEGYTSLFEYVVNALSLSRDRTYTLTSVARKCEEFPTLQK